MGVLDGYRSRAVHCDDTLTHILARYLSYLSKLVQPFRHCPSGVGCVVLHQRIAYFNKRCNHPFSLLDPIETPPSSVSSTNHPATTPPPSLPPSAGLHSFGGGSSRAATFPRVTVFYPSLPCCTVLHGSNCTINTTPCHTTVCLGFQMLYALYQ